MDPDTRARIDRLLARRPARLAELNQHAKRWPDTIAQLRPVTDTMLDEMARDGLLWYRFPLDPEAVGLEYGTMLPKKPRKDP